MSRPPERVGTATVVAEEVVEVALVERVVCEGAGGGFDAARIKLLENVGGPDGGGKGLYHEFMSDQRSYDHETMCTYQHATNGRRTSASRGGGVVVGWG